MTLCNNFDSVVRFRFNDFDLSTMQIMRLTGDKDYGGLQFPCALRILKIFNLSTRHRHSNTNQNSEPELVRFSRRQYNNTRFLTYM